MSEELTKKMKKVRLHWVTLAQMRAIDIEGVMDYHIAAYPSPNDKEIPPRYGIYESYEE